MQTIIIITIIKIKIYFQHRIKFPNNINNNKFSKIVLQLLTKKTHPLTLITTITI